MLDWCYEYLPHHFYGERAEFHQEIADLLANHQRVAVAAPRGHNKSTLVSLGYVLFRAATGRSKFILIVSDTASQAQDHVGNVQKELLENERLLADYPHLRLPELAEYKRKKVRRKSGDFITIGGVRFVAKGAGNGLRGLREGSQRPDLIVVDDLENDKNVLTARQRQKLKDWYTKSLSNLFGASGGQLLIIGTILHRESLLNWMLSEAGPSVYQKRLYRALFTDDDGVERALWPAAWSVPRLYEKLDEIKSRAFATEFLNQPSADDSVLFKADWIDEHRVKVAPEDILRLVLAIDPSTSSDGQRDACGMIIAGKLLDGKYLVLHDLTLNASPAKWARAALTAVADYGIDEIVAEANQGGAMIESVLKAALAPGERLPKLTLVHATRGKAIRAEPIAVEYEKGSVSHVGTLRQLEEEMTNWRPGDPSPNRLDALVWALTHLMSSSKKKFFAASVG